MTAEAKRDIDIPQVTIAKINRFRELLDLVRSSPTPGHASARVKLLYRSGAELSLRSDDLVNRLEQADRWFKTAPADHPLRSERDDQYIAWLREYEAIQDALRDGKGVL